MAVSACMCLFFHELASIQLVDLRCCYCASYVSINQKQFREVRWAHLARYFTLREQLSGIPQRAPTEGDYLSNCYRVNK